MALKIEIRSDETVHISGYVNAVDRFSSPIKDKSGSFFIEKIQPGAFQRAIERADDIGVMLNHERNLTTVKTGGIKLIEDNIGLHFDGDISDREIVERAKKHELIGWSFGFYPIDPKDCESRREGIAYERTLGDIDLIEVSIIDIRKKPCYPATSIEARGDGVEICLRADESGCEIFEKEDEEDKSNKAELEARKRKIEISKRI